MVGFWPASAWAPGVTGLPLVQSLGPGEGTCPTKAAPSGARMGWMVLKGKLGREGNLTDVSFSEGVRLRLR